MIFPGHGGLPAWSSQVPTSFSRLAWRFCWRGNRDMTLFLYRCIHVYIYIYHIEYLYIHTHICLCNLYVYAFTYTYYNPNKNLRMRKNIQIRFTHFMSYGYVIIKYRHVRKCNHIYNSVVWNRKQFFTLHSFLVLKILERAPVDWFI